MKPEHGKAPVPGLLLERYRLNEVSPTERAAVVGRLDEEETLRQRLCEIERSDEAIRGSGFTESLTRHLQRRTTLDATKGRFETATARASQKVTQWALPLAVGLTSVLLVVIASRTGGPRPDHSTADRIKGLRPSLTMFRQTPAGSEALADGAAARKGTVVRLAYQSAGRSYGAIVSIDGRGGVTVHLPATGQEAARLRPGDRVLLDQAYELDDAPGWECFYFVTAQGPFEVAPVIEAAQREASLRRASPPPVLPLPRGLEQSTFFLQKEDRP